MTESSKTKKDDSGAKDPAAEVATAPPVEAVNDRTRESTQPGDHIEAPMYWMHNPVSGNYAPANTEGDRVNLMQGGYEVTDKTPEGMPAATGGHA